MKKIFLFLLLIFLTSCSYFNQQSSINTSSGGTTSNVSTTIKTSSNENNVFKIMAFKHNDKFDLYERYSIGSSVLINNNELLTNAHIVLDSNQNLLNDFVACYNKNASTLPDCKYVVKVKYIDKDNDIAILSIDTKDINNESVIFQGGTKFYDGEVALQDDIYIYGYPFIGGDTITFLKGKVSGFSNNGDIKTDAQIDEGSSGGGAFSGNLLLGLSTYIISDNNTIGYIKPVSKIKEFLNNKDKFLVKSEISENFKNYYKKIYEYKNGKGIYKNNGLTLSGSIDNFELNEISYSKLTDYITFSGINGNKDIDLIIYGLQIFDKGTTKSTDLIESLNNFLYKNATKECENINTFSEKKNFKCLIHEKGKDGNYIRYIGFVVNGDKIYTTLIKSDESNGKDEEYIKQLFSQIESKFSYYDVDNKMNNILGDVNLTSISNFTKVIFPTGSNDLPYEVVLLNKENKYLIGDIKIITSDSLSKSVNTGKFNFDNYIYTINTVFSKQTGNEIYSIKKDRKGNQYILGQMKGFYDYLYFTYDAYIYETIFYVDETEVPKFNYIVPRTMTFFNINNSIKVVEDLSSLYFSQQNKKDLDGKWYIYENSLKDGSYDEYGEQYSVVSKNNNIDVSSGSIILKNNKSDWHINLAQTINYNTGMLNKKFNLSFLVPENDYSSYTVKLIVGKYAEEGNTIYGNEVYSINSLNQESFSTNTISKVIDTWRQENDFDVSVIPDIVRISIGINNNSSGNKSMIIKDLKLLD